MGEVLKTVRTLIVPNQAVATYVTQWKYDSHNRLLEMIYPDEEKITYSYNLGGQLEKVHGYKSYGYDYVSKIGYDKFEQRTYLKYCNGAETFYTYDPARRRLQNLVVNAKAGIIMDNAYSYDAVSNVLGIKNNAPLPQSGKAGGQMSHSYTYDPLYRLASATGTYKGTDNKSASYTLSMGYDNMHRITSKKQHLSQTGVQFDKNGVLNYRLLSKNEGSSDNFSVLKTLSESSTNYLFNVSDKDINGKAFFEKGTNCDYPNNYLYGITNLPNAENDPSPDENVYIFTALFLDERTQAKNTAHEGYGHAYFYELSKKDPSINPNHTLGKIGIQKEYDSELKMEIEFPVFGKTNTRLERQISTVEQQALKNYDEKNN